MVKYEFIHASTLGETKLQLATLHLFKLHPWPVRVTYSFPPFFIKILPSLIILSTATMNLLVIASQKLKNANLRSLLSTRVPNTTQKPTAKPDNIPI